MIRVSELKQAQINIIFYEKEEKKDMSEPGDTGFEEITRRTFKKCLKERMRQAIEEVGGMQDEGYYTFHPGDTECSQILYFCFLCCPLKKQIERSTVHR